LTALTELLLHPYSKSDNILLLKPRKYDARKHSHRKTILLRKSYKVTVWGLLRNPSYNHARKLCPTIAISIQWITFSKLTSLRKAALIPPLSKPEMIIIESKTTELKR